MTALFSNQGGMKLLRVVVPKQLTQDFLTDITGIFRKINPTTTHTTPHHIRAADLPGEGGIRSFIVTDGYDNSLDKNYVQEA